MARKNVYLGTKIFTYDDEGTYKDGEAVRPLRGDILAIFGQLLRRGEIIVGYGEARSAVLELGTPGQVLAVDPSSPIGVRWVDLVGGAPQLGAYYWISPGFWISGEASATTTVWLSQGFYIETYPTFYPVKRVWLSPGFQINTTIPDR